MGKMCSDCYYYSFGKCKKRNRSINTDDPACSNFVSDTHNACWECTYSEAMTGEWFAKDDDMRCTRTNKKVKEDALACQYFIKS